MVNNQPVVGYNQDDFTPQTKKLLKAVDSRDEGAALDAIRHGANIHYEMGFGEAQSNMLVVAANLGWAKVTGELLKRDKQLIDYKDGNGNNILHSTTATIYKLGLNTSDPSKDVLNMELNKRGSGNYEQVWDTLVGAKPSLLTERNREGDTPLAVAIKEHDSDFVRYLTKEEHSKLMHVVLAHSPVTKQTERPIPVLTGVKEYTELAKGELAKLKGPDGLNHAKGLEDFSQGGYDARKARIAEMRSEREILEALGKYRDSLKQSLREHVNGEETTPLPRAEPRKESPGDRTL